MKQLLASSALAIAAMGTAQPLAAQSVRDFTLPEPTPTPTSAPQGPADERAGVQIGPRVIRDRQATPTPTPTPPPAQTQTPAPVPTATAPSPTPTPTAQTRAPASQPATTRNTPTTRTAEPAQPASRPAQTQVPSQTPVETAPDTSSPSGPVIGPGFDTELIPEGREGPVGPDGWYDVTPSESGGDASTGSAADTGAPFGTSLPAVSSLQSRAWIGLGIMALLASLLVFLFWRRRRQEVAEVDTGGPSLAFGVHKAIKETLPGANDERAAEQAEAPSTTSVSEPEAAPEPEFEREPETAPEPAPAELDSAPEPDPMPAPLPLKPDEPVDPARLDLVLEIIGASRSVMMFTLDFSVEIANRSDRAVRDLSISGQLVCAQRGISNGPPVAGGQPITQLERIGPQQSRRVTGQLAMPLSEIKTIRQGNKPLFIPLLHLVLEGNGQKAMTRSYVLGTPSATSQGRVHPLTLDGPPGGLPPLRAQLIKQPLDQEQKSKAEAQTV